MVTGRLFFALALGGAALPLSAQPASSSNASPVPPQGNFHQVAGTAVAQPTLSAAGARKLVDAAVSKAIASGWTASITVVDAGGNLLAFQRLDGATLGTVDVSRRKAATALSFGMPSAMVGQMVQRGGPAMLTLGPDMVAVTGGAPILQDGKIIGAIGISGGFKGEDDRLVEAALAALRP